MKVLLLKVFFLLIGCGLNTNEQALVSLDEIKVGQEFITTEHLYLIVENNSYGLATDQTINYYTNLQKKYDYDVTPEHIKLAIKLNKGIKFKIVKITSQLSYVESYRKVISYDIQAEFEDTTISKNKIVHVGGILRHYYGKSRDKAIYSVTL